MAVFQKPACLDHAGCLIGNRTAMLGGWVAGTEYTALH